MFCLPWFQWSKRQQSFLSGFQLLPSAFPMHKATKEQKHSTWETCSSFSFPHIGLVLLRLLSPQAVVCFILSRVCRFSFQEDRLFKSSFLPKSRNLSKAPSFLLSPELIAHLLFSPAFLFLLYFPRSLLPWSLLCFSVILRDSLNSELLEDTSL